MTRFCLCGVLAACAAAPAAAQLTMRVSAPPVPPGTDVYVMGSFNGWNPAGPAFRLAPVGDDYLLTLPADVRGPIEFRFTLGSWFALETDSVGGGIENRTFVVPDTGAVTYVARIGGWRHPGAPAPTHTATPSVTVADSAMAMPQLGRTRRIWVYLPPDYARTSERYPVLYLQDGQHLFDAATSLWSEWRVDEVLDSLHHQGAPGVIVVGIEAGGPRRASEYSPWPHAGLASAEGKAYVDFIVETLKPWVDTTYRTKPDHRNTGIGGSSLGGLITLYAAARHPDVFGRALVLSPAVRNAPEILPHVRSASFAPGVRVWLGSGAAEGFGPVAAAQVRDHEAIVTALGVAGLVPGKDLVSIIDPVGTHSPVFWGRVFPQAYEWLFGR